MRAAAGELSRARTNTAACAGTDGVCGSSDRFTQDASAAGIQGRWAETPLANRVRIVRSARHLMAERAEELAAGISASLSRTRADTLVTELLPLLDACKFLEREAKHLLAPRKLGRRGRPLWLSGVVAEVHREPLGHVLVIGPSNFPLFLPGVQVMQALAAGNTVTWKPGSGGAEVAQFVAGILREAGLPAGVLSVTDESIEAAHRALAGTPDKVIFTGSSESGQSVLATLAGTSTPAVVELSGADAVVVMPSADLSRVAKIIAFGLRLNGAAVCMSPRRLFATPSTMAMLRPLLEAELEKVPAVQLDATTSARLRSMLADAVDAGAMLQGELRPEAQKPLVVDHATPRMTIAQSDLFAPVLSLIAVDSMLHVRELYLQCPYALTAAIFCSPKDEKKARVLAKMLRAGTVLINDAIAPTADPRVPFGGRGASGFGVTRGAEGLLEMTSVKTLLIRRSGRMRHLDPTTNRDAQIFASMIAAIHGPWPSRWGALKQLMKLAR